MKFNSSDRIDDDYYQSDDHYVLLDEEDLVIRLQNYRVRYGPGDDYRTLMDEEFSIAEFANRNDLHELVRTWFSEAVLQTILGKIASMAEPRA